jgi:hypothetical protein
MALPNRQYSSYRIAKIYTPCMRVYFRSGAGILANIIGIFPGLAQDHYAAMPRPDPLFETGKIDLQFILPRINCLLYSYIQWQGN